MIQSIILIVDIARGGIFSMFWFVLWSPKFRHGCWGVGGSAAGRAMVGRVPLFVVFAVLMTMKV